MATASPGGTFAQQSISQKSVLPSNVRRISRAHTVNLHRVGSTPHFFASPRHGCAVVQAVHLGPAGSQQYVVAAPLARTRTTPILASQKPALDRSQISGVVVLPSEAVQTKAEIGVHGLADLLARSDLQAREPEVKAWCAQSGAAVLSEVIENIEDLANDIGLTEEERHRFVSAGQESQLQAASPEDVAADSLAASAAPAVATHAASMPRSQTLVVQGAVAAPRPPAAGLAKLRSTPITGEEVQGASARVAKAYIPLHAWAPVSRPLTTRPTSAQQPAAAAGGLEPSLTASIQEVGEVAEDVASGRQVIRDSHASDRNIFSCRIKTAWELAELRHRIPAPKEMTAVTDAEKQWREAHVSEGAQARPQTFGQLQDQFMRQYAADIRREMPGVTITKANVGEGVQKRFMGAVQQLSDPQDQLMPTYHGTGANNFESIQEKGLLVPTHDGVTIAHGSAHGVGVYTAKLGSAWLSKGFAPDNKMLVCAVADPKDDKIAQPAADANAPARQKWTGVGAPGGQRFHRIHQKAADSSSGASTRTVCREKDHVRYAGDAVVVFDERCVTPLFVAENINEKPLENVNQKPASFAGNQRVIVPGRSIQVATHQVRVGEQRLWAPPEEDRWKKGMQVRRVWNTKEHDAQRRQARENKSDAQQLQGEG